MNWYLVFYFFSLADKISTVFGIISMISGIVLLVSVIVWMFNRAGIGEPSHFLSNKGELRIWKTFFISSLVTFLISISLWTFVPDRRDMLLIVAGGAVGQFIVSDENAKELPHDLVMLLRKEILELTAEEGGEEVLTAAGIDYEAIRAKTRKDSLKKLSKEKLIELLDQ